MIIDRFINNLKHLPEFIFCTFEAGTVWFFDANLKLAIVKFRHHILADDHETNTSQ